MRRVIYKARLYLNDVLWGERELSTPYAACTVQARIACVPVPVYTATATASVEQCLPLHHHKVLQVCELPKAAAAGGPRLPLAGLGPRFSRSFLLISKKDLENRDSI